MGAIIGFCFGVFVGGIISAVMVVNESLDVRHQAIKRGYATMVVTDTLTGVTEFKWKEPKP